MYTGLHVAHLLFLWDLKEIWLQYIFEKFLNTKLCDNPSVETEIHAGGRTDGRTDRQTERDALDIVDRPFSQFFEGA